MMEYPLSNRLTVRNASRLAVATEEELAEQARLYQRSGQREGMSFPLWYTNCIKLAVKDVCAGLSANDACARLASFPGPLKGKAEGLVRNFVEIVAANDDVDFTPRPSPPKCSATVDGVILRTGQDVVVASQDGKLLLLYLHVVDAPLKAEQAQTLLHLAQYITDAKQLNAEVAIVDVPRKRLIKVAESYDPEQIRRAVASAMSKLH
jgi:hypothetical protein